jgi:carbon-monoxide dehydrogenase large subunit
VIDALHRGYGITALDMPASPAKVWEAIRAAKAA